MAVNILSSNAQPDKYIHNPVDGVLQIPKIDLCLLNSSSSSPEGNQELKNLRLALSICGFFQPVNHGIEISSLEELFDVSQRFFSLPPEEKKKYSRPAGDRNDQQILTQHPTVDWKDRLYLDLYPEDQRRLKLWPENPKDFRKIVLGYRVKLQKLNELILKAMAKALNLEENTFLKQYGESPNVLSRFNSYAPCSGPQELPVGVKPHSDPTALTFFLQDKQAEGLQVRRDDQWFGIPVVPHAILVMLGDQAEIMTNGIFKSPIHRYVINNSQRETTTISVFFNPDKENVIEPAEGLIDEKRPRLYKPVVDYAGAFAHDYHAAQGNRLIDALKI